MLNYIMSTSWHSISVKDVLKELKTSVDGLEEKEVVKRLKLHGKNTITKKKKLSGFYILLSQFKSPLIYILIFASIISVFLGENLDATVILLAILVNVIIGFIQEYKANKALDQLKKLVERKARVLRGGREQEIDAESLVVGDIVVLEEGMRVSADGRLISVNELEVNESSLTGESVPIDKDVKALKKDIVLAERKNMVFMGTLVTRGRAYFVVTSIGIKTHFGEIANLVEETKEEFTPLQEKISKFSKFLAIIIVSLSVLIFIFGVFSGLSVSEMFLTSVAIAVSSIPEGLPIAITIILAIGMQKMSKKNALIRKMLAAETLGSVSVICTDKTGTLTLGEMRMMNLITINGDIISKDSGNKDSKNLLEKSFYISALCNNAVIEFPKKQIKDLVVLGDSTEKALLLKSYELGFDKQKLEDRYKRISELAFNSDRKFMATLNSDGHNGQLILVKGAPEIILKKCKYLLSENKKIDLKGKNRSYFSKEIEKMSSNGLRVLALAYKEVKNKNDVREDDIDDLILVGLVGLRDPLRDTSKATIELTKSAGIRSVIVTGDHILTAKAIGREIGLRTDDKNTMEGLDLEKINDTELKRMIIDIDIFARVSPKHKLRIINAWQQRGEVVAMTGDGVNDAPAIKSADIGVALGSGSDVTKETSDMVLLDDNFKSIVDAVRVGRNIFDNIRKVITYLLSDGFTEIILVSSSLAFGLPLPVTAAQILWVNIIDDSFPALSLAFDKADSDIMQRKPRKRNTPILNLEIKAIIFIVGIITSLFLFWIYSFTYYITLDLDFSRTIAFIGLGIDSLFIVYATRSLRHSIWHTNFWNNNYLNISVLFGILMLLFVVYIPALQVAFKTVALSWHEWFMLFGIGLFNLLMIELVKWVFIVRKKID